MTRTLRVGSLCTGYGGYELAATTLLGPTETLWHAENDDAAAAVLAARWPGVPNLGDITALTAGTSRHGRWADLPPVDILAAGYPCQGESHAGLRKGADDPRFRWPDVHAAIRALRPGLVLLENVRGHLNRSFPRVVADLAAIGYMGRWRCVRASDIGAPHERERLYAVAWPTDTNPPHLTAGATGDTPRGLKLLPTPTASDHTGAGYKAQGGLNLRTAATLPPQRWAEYAPAIARWTTILGRPAPAPLTRGPRGGLVLSPRFVEWLMGLPAGWVTDVIDHRATAIRILGNGIVPQAATHALRLLLAEPAQPALFDTGLTAVTT